MIGKSLLKGLLTLAVLLLTVGVNAQTLTVTSPEPTSTIARQTDSGVIFYQTWKKLIETSSRVDIFYRVIKCGDAPTQVHIMIYNESAKDQALKFDLELSMPNGDKMTREISFNTQRSRNYVPECGSGGTGSALKFDLPQKFYPYLVKAAITMKP